MIITGAIQITPSYSHPHGERIEVIRHVSAKIPRSFSLEDDSCAAFQIQYIHTTQMSAITVSETGEGIIAVRLYIVISWLTFVSPLLNVAVSPECIVDIHDWIQI